MPLTNDFDEIIDTICHPLIGVVPYDMHLYDSVLKNRLLPRSTRFSKAMYNIAKRYNNDTVPLIVG
jgi:septum formation inhibitor-activating ATPase MinD